MTVPTPELVALSRSAAMVTPGERYPVDREVLVSLCEELLDHRQLLERLGGDLRAVAAHARRSATPEPPAQPHGTLRPLSRPAG